ncbi:MAG TPA: PAS domain-containing protein [Pseudobdellovibrionaceae bacterium]|jgi:hypothetical protein
MSREHKETHQSLENPYPDYVAELPADHPVRAYIEENTYLREILREIDETDAVTEFQKFFNLFNQLSEVEKHYARKENQLFPFLERHGWTGPSQGMWNFHDAIRDLLRAVRKQIENKNVAGLNEEMRVIFAEMQRMMLIEETRLFPNALQLLTEEEWQQMRAGDEEIGWMLKTKPISYSQETKVKPTSIGDRFRLDEGFLTPEQVNLMLKFMPVDLTYVDENDRVLFYNRGEDRVFPRSAGIIGREVRFCHPPKSVGTVLRILEEFKKGTKNEAAFWIQFKGRIIHIRYFAIRDREMKYKGVIEMSQDITEIQKLEGEQRLLDWENDNDHV